MRTSSCKSGFRKVREPEIKLLTSIGSKKRAREFHTNIYFCFIHYAKALTAWITTNCGKFLKGWEYQTTLSASWEICMQVKKQLELDMEQWIGSKLGKEYIKAIYCHPAYWTNMQDIVQNARLNGSQTRSKIARRNSNNLRYADDIHSSDKKGRGTKEPLDESERGELKSWLKTQHSIN